MVKKILITLIFMTLISSLTAAYLMDARQAVHEMYLGKHVARTSFAKGAYIYAPNYATSTAVWLPISTSNNPMLESGVQAGADLSTAEILYFDGVATSTSYAISEDGKVDFVILEE